MGYFGLTVSDAIFGLSFCTLFCLVALFSKINVELSIGLRQIYELNGLDL